MAKFLVFNKENWMDLPSKDRPDLTGHENVQRKINEDSKLNTLEKIGTQMQHTVKYDMRSQIGDIVEARKDSTGMVGKEPLSFALITVPMTDEEAGHYTGGIEDKYLFKYSLDMSQITLNEKKEGSLTLSRFNFLLTEKT